MPYNEKQMDNVAYGVGKDGNAYMICTNNDSRKLELLNITNDLKTKINPLDISASRTFEKIDLLETADGNLTGVGYYGNGWAYSGADRSLLAKGVMSFKMDRTGKILSKYNFDFPIEMINQFEKERDQKQNDKHEKKGGAGITGLKVRNISLGADGSTTVIGEQQYITTVEFKNNQVGYTTKLRYNFGDIVATKYDKNGKLLWMKKLPKTQSGFQGRGTMSIRYIRGKAFHYVLYIDHEDNTNPDYLADRAPKSYTDTRAGYLMAYKIDDATGNTERHTIADTKHINGIEAFQFRTSRIFEAADNTFLQEIYIKGKEDILIKMVLN